MIRLASSLKNMRPMWKLISIPITSPIQEIMIPGRRPKRTPLMVRKGIVGIPKTLQRISKKKTHCKSPVTKRGNIAGQTIHISRQSQGDGIAVNSGKNILAIRKHMAARSRSIKIPTVFLYESGMGIPCRKNRKTEIYKLHNSVSCRTVIYFHYYRTNRSLLPVIRWRYTYRIRFTHPVTCKNIFPLI